jgi:uncharacterized protein (UPF0335 family)
MLNTTHVLERFNIDSKSAGFAIQEVRQIIEGSPDPLGTARSIISNLIEQGTDFLVTDPIEARMTAQYLVNSAITLGDKYDPNEALKHAAERIAIQRVENPWFFYKPTFSSVETVTETRHDVSVEVKADGKIKKGGKQILAQALYEKHKGKENKAIIEIFMKELNMSKAGATTYFYNAKKAAKST